MKLSSIRKKSAAFALIALMMSLGIILMVFAGLMYWVSTNAKQIGRNQSFVSSEAAAEGATEVIFAHMDRDYLYGTLSPNVNYYEAFLPGMTNWPVQYSYNV